jgi:hypothetical protein
MPASTTRSSRTTTHAIPFALELGNLLFESFNEGGGFVYGRTPTGCREPEARFTVATTSSAHE